MNYGLSRLRFTRDAKAFPFFTPACLALVAKTLLHPSCLRLSAGCCGLLVPATVTSASGMIIRVLVFVFVLLVPPFFIIKLIQKSEYCIARKIVFTANTS